MSNSQKSISENIHCKQKCTVKLLNNNQPSFLDNRQSSKLQKKEDRPAATEVFQWVRKQHNKYVLTYLHITFLTLKELTAFSSPLNNDWLQSVVS